MGDNLTFDAWLKSTQPIMVVERIRVKLAELRPRDLAGNYSNEAAVLMLICLRQEEPHFLLTLRTEDVQTHKGQISFPGGMREGGESLEQTALRETFEEVGIAADRIEILGRFHDYLSITDYRVTSFAGFIDGPFKTTPQATEVAEILLVPFSIFLDPGRMRTERMLHSGGTREVYFFSYGTHLIWGLTARIIKDFLAELQSGEIL
jgi:8-oxo-dGTP pyrophosphatase MutT (NUDIX family)